MQFTTTSRSLAFLPSPTAKKASSRVTKALLSSKQYRRKRRLNHHRVTEVKMSTTSSEMISVQQLLTDCIESCFLGCVQIREVRARGISSVKSKIEGDARSALTEADVKAQAVVIGSLRKTYGVRLNVVGEEDGNEDATPTEREMCESLRNDERFGECVKEAVRKACEDGGFRAGEDAVSMDDVCVFVDPVDGTREFVEGRLENCQCLIGISVNGRAVAGAIGLPFPKGAKGFEEDKDDAEKSAIVFGLCGMGGADDPESDKGVVGVFNEHLLADGYVTTSEVNGSERFSITTGDSKNLLLKASVDAVVEAAKENRSYLQDIDRPLVGGAGSKIANVAFGKADVAMMHLSLIHI